MKKVLLDENLDRRLKNYFSEKLDVTSVPTLGWQAKKNGELLAAMVEQQFDILLTADRNLRFQQNLGNYGLQVVIVIAFDNRLKALVERIDEIEKAILEIGSAESYVEVDLRSV